MGCADVRDLLQPFLDGELEVPQNVAVLKHLELCAGCRERSQEEERLRATVAGALATPLSEVERRRLLDGAFARVGSAEAAPRRTARFLGAAAGLLLAVGLGGAALAERRPCLLGQCPTAVALDAAFETSRRQAPLPLAVVARDFPRTIRAPKACNVECEGYNLVTAPGAPPRPLVRLRCRKTGRQVAFFKVPGHGLCFHGAHVQPDGRRYVEREADGVRIVGWQEADGTFAACLAPDSMPFEALYTMAAAVRDDR